MAHPTTPELDAALAASTQYPLFQVLHEKGSRETTWTGSGGARHVLAVYQSNFYVALLWREAGNWYVGRQLTSSFVTEPAAIATTDHVVQIPSTGRYMPYEELPHRVSSDNLGSTLPLFQVTMCEDEDVVLFHGSIEGVTEIFRHTFPSQPRWVAVCAHTHEAGVDIGHIFYAKEEGDTYEALFAQRVDTEDELRWAHWVTPEFHSSAPFVYRDIHGIYRLYFTAQSQNGKGKTLYKCAYDFRVHRWGIPEEVVVFDTTNPLNGIEFPCVSEISNTHEVLTYVRKMADSNATNQRTFVVMRVKDKKDSVWGEELYLTSLDVVGSIPGRTIVEDPQYYFVVFDRTTNRFLVLNQQGWYKGNIGFEFGGEPKGTDITNVVESASVQMGEGLSAGSMNLTFADMDAGLAFMHGDKIHFKSGIVVDGEPTYFDVISGVMDVPRYTYGDAEWTNIGRTIHALGVSQGQQDTATRWIGANHTAYKPTTEDFNRYVEQGATTQTTATALAQEDPVAFSTSYQAANGNFAASTKFLATAVPPDRCTPVTIDRHIWFAEYVPDTDITFEATFELMAQQGSVDPYPFIFVAANQKATCFFGLGYKTKTRTINRIIRRETSSGILDTETLLVTLTTIPKQITLRLRREGNRLASSYRINNGEWVVDVEEYVDTTVPGTLKSYPTLRSTEGYCGVGGFAKTTGLIKQTNVSFFVSSYRAVTHRPPRCLEHLLEDGMRICGYAAYIDGVGRRRPDKPTIGVGISDSLPSQNPWVVVGEVYESLGTIALLRAPDSRVDTLASIEVFTDVEAISLVGRFIPTESPWETSGTVTPYVVGYEGSGIGVSLYAPESRMAAHHGTTTYPYLWIWYQTGTTRTTLTHIPIKHLPFILETGLLQGGRYVLGIQGSMLGVWFGDTLVGALDIGIDTLPFTTLRSGSSFLLVEGDRDEEIMVAGELWMSIFNTPISDVAMGVTERAIDWVDAHLTANSADIAFRGSLQGFYISRADIPRTIDHYMEDEVVDGNKETSGYEWLSHVRVVGKNGIYGDAYDIDKLINRSHRFQVIEDETLITVEQCQQAARRFLAKTNRSEDTVDSALVYNPRIELLDIVNMTIEDDTHTVIVSGFSLNRTTRNDFFVLGIENKRIPNSEDIL